MPPHLAGRTEEKSEFLRLLQQDVILENLVLTGLRGVGKTVLLDTLKPMARENDWLWAGTDLSESVSISEIVAATRLITDLSVVTSNVVFEIQKVKTFGFKAEGKLIENTLNYEILLSIFNSIPGLVADKLKGLLEFVWGCIKDKGYKGIIFAYDEAQTMSDHAKKNEYPLSLLLDVFQSIQKKNIPFMLVLTGLPTLFPKLVESRTFAERMFRILFLDKLNEDESREAITKPLEDPKCSLKMSDSAVDLTIKVSGGYPYFIQFICREMYDILSQYSPFDKRTIPVEEITRKLDNDFFAGRWARATDRQRELLEVIANLPTSEKEFTVQDIVEASKVLDNPFSSSHVNQMLSKLVDRGLVYKNRHGKYSFAVPLLGQFILRLEKDQQGKLF
ncbi:MAG: ATP-binding protein [Planctomycetes bacterium]|nr:ATP-binding protein [Planctomycetota bacterium]